MKGKKYLLLLFLLLLFCSFPVSAFAMGDGDEGGVAMQTIVPLSIISGKDGVFTKGSSSDLAFSTNASKSDFETVLIDGNKIGFGNYTVSGEPLSVSLKASFLQTLSVGTHTVTVKTSVGSAETNFSVKDGQSGSPATGDSSNMLLWILLLAASGAALTGTAIYSRKKKHS